MMRIAFLRLVWATTKTARVMTPTGIHPFFTFRVIWVGACRREWIVKHAGSFVK